MTDQHSDAYSIHQSGADLEYDLAHEEGGGPGMCVPITYGSASAWRPALPTTTAISPATWRTTPRAVDLMPLALTTDQGALTRATAPPVFS